MFVEASVQSDAETEPAREAPLVVPATAPLFTGRRSVVYIEVEGVEAPTYEARVVTLGTRMGELYPVLGGLHEGERVVVHGAFAIDADLQIQGGESMMNLEIDHDMPPEPEVARETQDQAPTERTKPRAPQRRPKSKAAPKPAAPETPPPAKPTAPTGLDARRPPVTHSPALPGDRGGVEHRAVDAHAFHCGPFRGVDPDRAAGAAAHRAGHEFLERHLAG